MKPKIMTYAQLADVLQDMAARAAAGDSFEGSIEYGIPEEDGGPDAVEVRAMYRIGNRQGQGGMRIIGDTS